jgi:hypothetical protein
MIKTRQPECALDNENHLLCTCRMLLNYHIIDQISNQPSSGPTQTKHECYHHLRLKYLVKDGLPLFQIVGNYRNCFHRTDTIKFVFILNGWALFNYLFNHHMDYPYTCKSVAISFKQTFYEMAKAT